MADRIVCPVCGESNPADMEFCRNCQSRLRPVGEDNEAIQPGELPTKKQTSELEPLLPQWLRDARQKARDTESQQEISEQQPAEPAEASAPDLLAGLASQSSDEEEEIPEWLAHITGAETRKKKPVPEDNQVKWVELGRGEEQQESPLDVGEQPVKREPEQDPLGDWFRQAAASSETADFRMPAPPAEESQPPAEPVHSAESEDLGWLQRLDAATAAPAEETPTPAPGASDETPDWLKKLQQEQAPAQQPPQAPHPAIPPQGAVPDWLKSFGEETAAVQPTEASVPEVPASEEPLFEPELPDWLKSVAPSVTEPAQPEPAHEEAPAPMELPDWLSALGSRQPESPVEEPANETPFAAETSETAAANELPDWVSSLGSGQAKPPAEEAVETRPFDLPIEEPATNPASAFPIETPDWLSSLRAEQDAPKEEAIPSTPQSEEPATPSEATPAALPGWLATLRAQQEMPQEEATPAFPPSAEAELPAEEPAAASTTSTQESMSGEDADAIFASMQRPDWLSAVLPTSTPEDYVPAASSEEEPIGPAELPSWVQAMRPVESAMAATPSATEDVATESQGPLAGLRGVLPVIPGAGAPSSKPKAHSIKLDATEQQQAHAALLEQILAAETSPTPMKSGAVLRSQRILRWVLSALVIAVLGGVLFAKTEAFQLPSGVPNETVSAIQAVESIPDGASVLMVFDYQPATVGEMEATGASLIDHLLLLKHPNVVLLSTSPTGPALAEHFLSSTLADRAYVQGAQYVNLGFLPGGLAGVYNFAQNPRATKLQDFATKSATPSVWETSSVLSRVERFSDFAAIIVLTDSVESGRTWVEQTQASRGNSLLVFVSSAQAGPMLLPYVDSGQVNGMVSGIYGAAGTEQRNAGSPAIYGLPGAEPASGQLPGYVRRYWDAYSVGLYLAVIAIILGAIANVWLGMRDRRAGAVG